MPLVFSIFSQDILPIFVIAAVGFVLARRLGASVRTVSTVSFHALSPCLVFDQLVSNRVDVAQAWRVVVFCLLLTAALGLVARTVSIPLRLERSTLSSFMLVTMFSNSGNYALPVVLFAFGRESLAFASVYFVTSAILVYTVGVFVAAVGHGDLRGALKGVLRVPAVWAVVAAIIVLLTRTDVPPAIMRPVGMLSEAAIPVMLLVLGMQLERHERPEHPGAVATAVGVSLVVAPALAFGLAALLGLTGAARQAAVLEASMPAAVATTVLALQYDLDPTLSTSVVLFSTLLSPFTLVFLIAALQAGW